MIRSLARMMGLSVEKEYIEALYEAYGGHPFLTRQVCSHLSGLLPDRPNVLSLKLYEHERERVDLVLRGVIDQVLDVLRTWYPDEYYMLEMLANGHSEDFVGFANDDPKSAAHLVGYGLVRDVTGTPSLTVGLIRDVLRSNSSSSADRLETAVEDSDWETIIAEVSLRRNRIEKELRRVVSAALGFAFGQSKGARLLECIEGKRRERLSKLAYRDVWEELYFDELITIVTKYWSHLETWLAVSESEFVRWLREINRGRIDAHARGSSPDELAWLRVCFRRVEEKLEFRVILDRAEFDLSVQS